MTKKEKAARDEDELASARKIRNGCGGRECKEGACQFFFWDRVGWPSCRLMVDENGEHIPPCLWKLGDEKEGQRCMTTSAKSAASISLRRER